MSKMKVSEIKDALKKNHGFKAKDFGSAKAERLREILEFCEEHKIKSYKTYVKKANS